MNDVDLYRITARGGPFGLAMAHATLARDIAYRSCRNPRLREVARVLDDFEGVMWHRGDDIGAIVAIAATLIGALVLDSPRVKSQQLYESSAKLAGAVDSALADRDAYLRSRFGKLLEAYRLQFRDICACHGDTIAGAVAREIVHEADRVSARNNGVPTQVEIDAYKRAIAVLASGVVA
ncbi:hypothetical protein MGS313_PGAPTMP_003677 [Burkholderia pseudomallei]